MNIRSYFIRHISLAFCSLILTYKILIPQPSFGQIDEISCSDIRPLISWYSPSRGDNFATSMPLWGGPIGVQRSPDYRAYRNEGYVFLSPKRGTVPLYRYYFPTDGDNWTTSDPRYAPDRVVNSDEFRFSRLEGYIYDPSLRQPENTLPLDNSWSSSRKDRFLSSDSIWTGEIGKRNSPDYTIFRREGYILDPRNFIDCEHEINESGTLPDFTITRLERSMFPSYILVTVKNTGAPGIVSRIQCGFPGDRPVIARINQRLNMDGFISTQIRLEPRTNQAVTCSVWGVNLFSDSEPFGPNNTLSKVID